MEPYPDTDEVELSHRAAATTRLVTASLSGDLEARSMAVQTLYRQLRQVASRHLARERDGHTLSTTALVHEAYLRLADGTQLTVHDRQHFVALASIAMRRLLVDYARRYRLRDAYVRTTEPDVLRRLARGKARPEHLVALDEALTALDEHDTRLSRLVELRFFAGFTMTEAADELGFSKRSAERAWVRARAFLHAYLTGRLEPSRSARAA